MTLVLAIETATPRCSVAIGDEAGQRAGFSVERDRRHVEALVPAVATACAAAGLALADLDAVAVDTGPGLFTGMRVGIATAQALALALDLPVHPVCSLDVLAHPFRHTGRPVAAVVDARRGEVFRSLHRGGTQVEGPACTSPVALAAELSGLGTGRGAALAVGDGAVRHRAVLEAAGAQVAAAMPSAEAALELALAGIGAGATGLDPARVQACYLRAPDARANFAVLPQTVLPGLVQPGAGPSGAVLPGGG